MEGIVAALQAASEYGACAAPVFRSHGVEVTYFADHESKRFVVFAANTQSETSGGTIRFTGYKRFFGLVNCSDCEGDGSIPVLLEPYSVCAWETQ